MGRHQIKTNHRAGEFIKNVPEKEKVPQRFGHFFRIDGDKTVVNPIMDRFTTVTAFTLGDLIFVMGKNQIRTRHRGYQRFCQDILVDMAEHSICQPGRPFPQGLSQAGSPGFAAFHKAKSKGSRFCSPTGNSGSPPAPLHLIKRTTGKLAVRGKFSHFEIDIPH